VANVAARLGSASTRAWEMTVPPKEKTMVNIKKIRVRHPKKG
jgi:hypothetical protein